MRTLPFFMHVIAMKALKLFWTSHPDSETPLRSWYKNASRATWKSLVDVRISYPHADLYKSLTIFNIGGNKYRLITLMDYASGKVFIRFVLTHSEYDRESWKKGA